MVFKGRCYEVLQRNMYSNIIGFCDLLIFKRSKVWGVEHESSNNQIRIIKEEDYTDMVINQY